MSNTIYFDDFDDIDDITFDLEEQLIYEEPEKKPKNIEKPKEIKRNRLGLTSDETEIVIASILGFIFLISLVGSLCGYSYWYMNIK